MLIPFLNLLFRAEAVVLPVKPIFEGLSGIKSHIGQFASYYIAVLGNMNQLDSLSLFQAANSITSALANEFAEAGEGLHQAALMYLGLVLFFITFVVLTFSKLLLSRLQRNEGTNS